MGREMVIPLDAVLMRFNLRRSGAIPKFGVCVGNSVSGVSGLSGTSVCGLLSVEIIELISQLVGIGFWVDIGHHEVNLVCCRLCVLIREN
ncbi:hypothetical protein LOK49_LG05G01339 [Camellia lanceoleosa]|uniref:Uncharacterized protein n=1 Tax=Camellia lanceoleosa TaxID=1840588 RepID=A0ACC0HUB0_9ERIC|nr:hypothetical protein LOK49_LG05G01339 [Camellia lanceoleosa]